MAKVLLVNGSAHKEGNTYKALKEVAMTLDMEGVDSEIFHIGIGAVRGCIACGQCKMNSLHHCVFDDDVANKILDKAAKCDGFVFGVPVYYGMPDGRFIALLQRMLNSAAETFAFKPVANVAVCRRGGATAAIQAMNMPWLMMNCPIVPSQYWNIAYGDAAGEVLSDREGMQTMRTMARNMAWMIGNLKRDGAPKLEKAIHMNFIKPGEKKR